MIITKVVRPHRIFKGTWKTFLINIITCFFAYFLNKYLLISYFEYPAIIPTVLGTALAFFIGFNNNQAYDRWWEGRKIWGALVNDSRTWTREIIQYISTSDTEKHKLLEPIKKRMIFRHIAFLYALKENLRGSDKQVYKNFLSESDIKKAGNHSNIHNALLLQQSEDIELLNKEGLVDGFKFLSLNNMITRFCDEMGKSERIKNTVFPTTYNYYTLVFIWVFIVSLTIVISNLVGLWAVIFGSILGYVYLTSHRIGQALMNPFNPIPTGIPLDSITRTIEINLLEMLGEKDIPKPVESINNEYIM